MAAQPALQPTLVRPQELISMAAKVLCDPGQTVVDEALAFDLAGLLESLVRARNTGGAPPAGFEAAHRLAITVIDQSQDLRAPSVPELVK